MKHAQAGDLLFTAIFMCQADACRLLGLISYLIERLLEGSDQVIISPK